MNKELQRKLRVLERIRFELKDTISIWDEAKTRFRNGHTEESVANPPDLPEGSGSERRNKYLLELNRVAHVRHALHAMRLATQIKERFGYIKHDSLIFILDRT